MSVFADGNRSAGPLRHACQRPQTRATGARTRQKAADVARAVADQWHPAAGEGREDDFTGHAVRHRRAPWRG